MSAPVPQAVPDSDPGPLRPESLIERDRVHRRVYVDPEIFELEMERLWGRAWLYVGHESQVPAPGSYFATDLARQPVLMVRHTDNRVRVFYNRCTHKGSQLAADRCGTVGKFRCAYHGWVFETDGTLSHTPKPEGYMGTGYGLGDPRANLCPLPRVQSYRGFVFASLCADGPDLEPWLGAARESFDNAIDRAPDGEIEIVGDCLRYLHDANWKILLENVMDNMHAPVTHQSASQPAKQMLKQHGDIDPPLALTMLEPFGGSYEFFDRFGATVWGQGHSYSGGTVSLHSSYPEIPEYLSVLEAKQGAQRTREILSVQRFNTIVFPSVNFKCALQTIRVYRPLAVDRTVQETWTFRLKGAPESVLRRSAMYNRLIFSPSSIAGHDDYEVYHRVQAGLQSQSQDWVSGHRNLDEGVHNADGTITGLGTSDIVFRHQFAAWRDYMLEPRSTGIRGA